MHTIRLVYVSTARPGLDYEELTGILRAAVDQNASRGITGMLVYGNGTFLQVLEGSRSAINRLYNAIVRDPRHTDCEVMEVVNIASRSFSEWSMKLIGMDDAQTAKRRALALRHSSSTEFDPRLMTGEQAVRFLVELAALERSVAAQAAA